MKKIFLLLSAIMIVHITIAQEMVDYDRLSSKLVALYNAAQYDSIWHLYSKEMKEHRDLENTKDLFTDVKKQLGKMTGTNFDHSKEGRVTYKLSFEGIDMSLGISLNHEMEITGLTITQYVSSNLPIKERNTTKIDLPVTGEWNVAWGGDTREQNMHVDVPAQKNAFDMLKFDKDGSSHKGDGNVNEDYYAFGQKIMAPCDAEVVFAVDGIKDNKPGVCNPSFIPGNSLMLKTANDEYMLLAHFKQYTIKVDQGDRVKKGQLLGYCGNSGNSTEPHLHFHIENIEDMNMALGVKCYFDHIVVNDSVKTDYSPVKGDKVKNVSK
ncbi:MAG: peptidase [Flavipsychrobacter sp.]|nr:peptidase [Flavipsychrobacter sp.]